MSQKTGLIIGAIVGTLMIFGISVVVGIGVLVNIFKVETVNNNIIDVNERVLDIEKQLTDKDRTLSVFLARLDGQAKTLKEFGVQFNTFSDDLAAKHPDLEIGENCHLGNVFITSPEDENIELVAMLWICNADFIPIDRSRSIEPGEPG